MKGFLAIIQGLLFIAPLLIYFGSVDDTSLYTSSFSQGELISHDSSPSTSPSQPGETSTYPNLPHETPPHDPTHGSQSSNSPQNNQTNTSSPATTPSDHHASLSFSKYTSKSGYNPEASPLDLLSMNQMKVTVVELQGTSSALVKGGVIPIRSVKELAICALNFTKSCNSKYPADVIDLLYAFAPIYTWEAQSNFRALYENHRNFRDYCHSIGIPVVVLEAIYPGQTFLATKPGNEPWEIQLHVEDSFYYRENFLNVAARKVDKWEYLLWIDAHQLFLNTYWWEESIVKLEKYGTVQLFQYLYYMRRGGNWTDMNVNYAGIQYARYLTTPFFNYFEVLRGLWAGNAWGIRREVYKELDRILDECISGWCDSAYNVPTFGEFEDWALVHYPGYKVYMMPWLENAGKVFRKYGVGPALVRGNIVHFDHERASKAEIEHGYRTIGADPVTYNFTRDLYRDENYTIHSRKGSPTASLYTKREWK